MLRVIEHESVRRSGIKPDVENIVDFLPNAIIHKIRTQKALASTFSEPSVGPFGFERSNNAVINLIVL